MIGNCETCSRKSVPCFSCQDSQRIICHVCNGDVPDPYGELDEPRGERAITQARIGNLLHDFRSTIDELIRLRLHPVGAPFIADEEAELMAIKTSLDFLLSDILAARKLRIVR